MTEAPQDKRMLVAGALMAGLGYEDAAVQHDFPVAEARAIFADLHQKRLLGLIVAESRRRAARP
ncbi:hypothetical protein LOS78_01715 [Paracoccus sp. MA]|uniref:hypothetical protein n=1 Tax=Paracoccus sp. MA TaxID=2895796 RepID=UPI001E43F39E|nr:hypothetical protein [Paracoccus sp. MA]UFM64216.1 hypothetical protein LOS78_01715 [Paracoccus sp. MA]